MSKSEVKKFTDGEFKKCNDITSETFGKLTATKPLYKTTNSGLIWQCVCECGEVSQVSAKVLASGATKSCGCGQGKTHGMSGTKEYRAWRAAQDRCYNTNVPEFKNYGARGITFPAEWIGSFENFFADMGFCPDNCTLERKDVNMPYSKENCIWDTIGNQNFNRRRLERNTSGRTGVSWCKLTNKWKASINKDGVGYILGYFLDIKEAVNAREEAELKYYGFIKEESL